MSETKICGNSTLLSSHSFVSNSDVLFAVPQAKPQGCLYHLSHRSGTCAQKMFRWLPWLETSAESTSMSKDTMSPARPRLSSSPLSQELALPVSLGGEDVTHPNHSHCLTSEEITCSGLTEYEQNSSPHPKPSSNLHSLTSKYYFYHRNYKSGPQPGFPEHQQRCKLHQ